MQKHKISGSWPAVRSGGGDQKPWPSPSLGSLDYLQWGRANILQQKLNVQHSCAVLATNQNLQNSEVFILWYTSQVYIESEWNAAIDDLTAFLCSSYLAGHPNCPWTNGHINLLCKSLLGILIVPEHQSMKMWYSRMKYKLTYLYGLSLFALASVVFVIYAFGLEVYVEASACEM